MSDILHTPWWISVARGFQVFLALVVFALAATIIHDVYLEELGLCIATGLITWLVTAYLIITEKNKSLQHLYHIIAVMCLEAFMLILWLATFAATAARRAGFVYNVSVDDCYNDGSTVNSSHCSYLKRSILFRRAVVLFKAGQGLMSGAAGLGALVWLLYILTFVWTVVMFVRGRKEGRFISSSSSPSQDHQLEEAKTETVHLQQNQAPPPPQQQQPQPPMNQYAQQPHPQQQYVQGHQAVSPDQHQYTPSQISQPYTPSPVTHYAGTAPTTSPSPPSEVASYGHHHQSELAGHGPPTGYPVQMPTYDEHYHQTDYAQQHTAELPVTQATYTPQQDLGYNPPQH